MDLTIGQRFLGGVDLVTWECKHGNIDFIIGQRRLHNLAKLELVDW